jgi:hypothetical protein
MLMLIDLRESNDVCCSWPDGPPAAALHVTSGDIRTEPSSSLRSILYEACHGYPESRGRELCARIVKTGHDFSLPSLSATWLPWSNIVNLYILLEFLAFSKLYVYPVAMSLIVSREPGYHSHRSFLGSRAPLQMLRTHRSLEAYCATLWWRWLVFSSVFLVM